MAVSVGRWRLCVVEMSANRYLLGLVLFGALVMVPGCFIPETAQFYKLVVANYRHEPVIVFVNGRRRGPSLEMVNPCTQQVFVTSAVMRGVELDIAIKDVQGVTLQTEHREIPRSGNGIGIVRVDVVGEPGNVCPVILPTASYETPFAF